MKGLINPQTSERDLFSPFRALCFISEIVVIAHLSSFKQVLAYDFFTFISSNQSEKSSGGQTNSITLEVALYSYMSATEIEKNILLFAKTVLVPRSILVIKSSPW